jgi:uncharacterized protein
MLLDKLKSDLITAMKAKEEMKVSTLRFLLSAINNKQIELQRDLTDEDVAGVIGKQIKERKESIEAYTAGNRQDLVDKEKQEMDLLLVYMPAQMPEEELENIVKQVIGETGASSLADFGKVMGAAMARVKGKADGNMVAEIVKKTLLA